MRATPKARLEALKTRYVSTPDNQQLGDAASSGKEDVMNLILSHLPDLVTQKNSSEDTPLHVAIRDERLNATRMLIPLRTDLDIMYWKNKDGKSRVFLAAETEHWEILQLLLLASARDEAYAVNTQGMSPVLAALEKGKSGENLIIAVGQKGDATAPATSVGNVEAVQLLLSKCSYLALQTDKNGYYLIHIACEGGSIDIIHELMKMWPDVAEMKNRKGQKNNAVHHILKECSEPVIKKLVNSKDVDGNTPLHLASMNNHCQVMLSLVRNKRSDVKLLNNNKMTALDVALNPQSWSSHKSPLLARAILVKAGAWQKEGANVLLPRKSSGASKSPRAEWIKDQVDTLLLVATLVATVTLTAGFTLPGGYNDSSDRHPGTATMLHDRVFQVFVISDM
ncbi:ankyrin repeat-containing protein ITN1-like [Eucalyptus grandis]|uniref:ankyrin repeat-containing protein ITN1-like n=1 Tax=Eucalyptus grandis TaxID=71139 RepID=UPI00192EC934|nr:ankyrin repeat-containing protein ITN1-like [Eucalyptus grandis]